MCHFIDMHLKNYGLFDEPLQKSTCGNEFWHLLVTPKPLRNLYAVLISSLLIFKNPLPYIANVLRVILL